MCLYFLLLSLLFYTFWLTCVLCVRRSPEEHQLSAAAVVGGGDDKCSPLHHLHFTHTHKQVCIICIIIRKPRSHTRTKYDWCSDHDRMNILGMRHYDAGPGYIYIIRYILLYTYVYTYINVNTRVQSERRIIYICTRLHTYSYNVCIFVTGCWFTKNVCPFSSSIAPQYLPNKLLNIWVFEFLNIL